jgi:ketopantoate reductase
MAIPPHRLPGLLRLPDFIFRRLASKMLAIDPLARTSMWKDLQAGHRTEMDYLNGEVVPAGRVPRAHRSGQPTPGRTDLRSRVR